MYAKTAQSHLMAECYIKLILAHTFRLTETEKPKMFSPKKSPAARLSLYTIIRYVDDNFMDFPGIDEMAKTLGYSPSYISHVFKEKMGLTLQEYIGKKKIEASLDFLKYQKYTITQIAMMLNYASVQSFGKAFRKAMGCSPTEYQRLHGSEKGNEDGDTGR
jgi:AraC-like DNA-binding protein